MYVKGNQAEAAIGFLTHMIETSEDEDSRKALEAQLQQARLEQAALPIDEAAQRYREQFGWFPASPAPLVAAGFLDRVPPDPFGGSWRIDEDGRVHSTVNPRRLFKADDDAQRGRNLDRLRSTLNKAQPR
jgi:hypothetical protein